MLKCWRQRWTLATDIKVYFCDPQNPRQRGSNENTSGRLRQYFSKGSDLSVHSQAKLNAVASPTVPIQTEKPSPLRFVLGLLIASLVKVGRSDLGPVLCSAHEQRIFVAFGWARPAQRLGGAFTKQAPVLAGEAPELVETLIQGNVGHPRRVRARG